MDLGVNAVVTELLWYYAVHCTAVGVWMCVLLQGFNLNQSLQDGGWH